MSEAKTDLEFDLNNLDKSNWKTYRFDEIAKNISERVDPNNTDLTVYIGLEHIDSESLHIKRHGTPDDVNGTKLKFYKGDIIFGRRRAYQRKAGIATWDGFCSAHALVLRANPDVIDPELFPFFLHSDLFMNRAIDISVGSLSPTINWGTLKHQEFLLPPLEIQKQLCKALLASEYMIQKNEILTDKLQTFISSFFYDFLKSYRQLEKIKLGDVCVPKQWKTISTKNLTSEGYVVYGGNGVIGKYNEYNHDDSVIAISCRGEYCGNVHYTVPKSYITGNSMCLDELDSEVFYSKFLFYVLFYLNLDAIVTGSAQPQIIKSDVENFKVNKIEINKQIEIANKMDTFWNMKDELAAKSMSSNNVKNSLINKVF